MQRHTSENQVLPCVFPPQLMLSTVPFQKLAQAIQVATI